jgi:alkylresorcinol/alkylpyrone synthase
MAPSARLLSLATALPPHVVTQREVAAEAQAVFGRRYEEFDYIAPVFDNAGIATRHAVRPISWYVEPRGWPERTAAYLEAAQELFVAAAGQALARAGLGGRDVDTIVTISSTGIATPSLEARVFTRMGFREDVMRVPVFGLGCAGGVSGLAIAGRLAEARPGTNVLLVTLELCTLAFRLDELTKANIVATALFGDGAAACLLRAGEGGIADIEGAGEHTWADTLDVMGWSVDPQGFGVIFARTIPPFIEEHMAPAVAGILDRMGLGFADVDRFVCHAGGTKVLAALEQALDIGQGALDHERAVLSACGNMSAPTVLFVLERVIDAGLPQRCVLTAMGPGFTASCLSLQKVA